MYLQRFINQRFADNGVFKQLHTLNVEVVVDQRLDIIDAHDAHSELGLARERTFLIRETFVQKIFDQLNIVQESPRSF